MDCYEQSWRRERDSNSVLKPLILFNILNHFFGVTHSVTHSFLEDKDSSKLNLRETIQPMINISADPNNAWENPPN